MTTLSARPRVRGIARTLAVARTGLLSLVLVGGLAVAVTTPAGPGPAAAAEPTAPEVTPRNALVFLVDDMDDYSCASTRRYLPKSSRWLLDRGTCFENASTPTPVCCPSRSELMTGQLSHNNGVTRQIDARKLNAKHTIQYALGRAGVATYASGKMLNGVRANQYMSGKVKTGFDDFNFWNTTDYTDYQLFTRTGRAYTPHPKVHATVRTGTDIRSFVERQADAGEPFYGYAAFFAPHTENREETDRGKFPDPTPANDHRAVPPFRFSPEKDTRDKLAPFKRLEHGEKYYRDFNRERVQALYDVDDQIAATFELLEEKGLLETTAVIFASDNGYHLGQNNWETKAVPYRPSVDIPMLAYLPGRFAAGRVDRRLASMIDIAPTLWDLFGLTPNHRVDGHSLAGRYRRRGEFFEYRNERNKFVLQESGTSPFRIPTWAMYRQGAQSYIEYYQQDGSLIRSEYYKDRTQQRNLLWRGDPAHTRNAGRIKAMRHQLHRLRSCSGTTAVRARNPCT